MVAQDTAQLDVAAWLALFEHCADGVLFCREDGAVTLANPAACVMLATNPAQIVDLSLDGLVDHDDPRWTLAVAERRRNGTSSCVARLRRGDGHYAELEIAVRSFRGDDGSAQLCCTLRETAGRAAIEREIEELSARLLQLSRVDDLTGFQNRRGLVAAGTQLFAQADRAVSELQVLFVDVRNVQELNERLSHEAGDSALQAVARALSVTFRTTDLLARVGGTTFVVLARDLHTPQLEALVECVRAHLDAPETTAYIGAGVDVAFGWNPRHPGDPTSLEELITRADRAASRSRRPARVIRHHT